jgi:hypothetical protein
MGVSTYTSKRQETHYRIKKRDYLYKPLLVQKVADSINYPTPNDKGVSDVIVNDHIQISLAVSGFL